MSQWIAIGYRALKLIRVAPVVRKWGYLRL